METATRPAPLRAITETRPGPPHVLEFRPGESVELKTFVYTLECGHETEPVIRDGCRVPKPPRRKRCKRCLEEGKASG